MIARRCCHLPLQNILREFQCLRVILESSGFRKAGQVGSSKNKCIFFGLLDNEILLRCVLNLRYHMLWICRDHRLGNLEISV